MFFFNVELASDKAREYKNAHKGSYVRDKLIDFLVACYSKSIAATFVNPINVVKTRVEAQTKSEIYKTFKNVFSKSGPFGYFKGYGATLIRDVPYSGLQFLFYKIIFDLEPYLVASKKIKKTEKFQKIKKI